MEKILGIFNMKTIKNTINRYKDAIGHELLLLRGISREKECIREEPSHYWVLEKSDGNMYLYAESKEFHDLGEMSRRDEKLKRMDDKILCNDCDISDMPNDSYFVLSIDPAAPKKSSKKASKKVAKKTTKKKTNKR